MTRRVLIAGGGIGGMATALAMCRSGIEAQVYEASEDPTRDVGTFLSIAANGLRALDRIGGLEPVLAAGFLCPTMNVWSARGKLLGRMPFGGSQYGGPAGLTIGRGRLVDVLAEEARRHGARIETGRRLVAATEVGSEVVARFEDGTEVVGDALIGSDGVNSTVRQIIDRSAPTPRYTGLFGFGGSAVADIDIAPNQFNMVFGGRAFFGYVRRPEGETWWFANVPRADEPSRVELASVGSQEWKRRLVDLFSHDATPAAAVIAATRHELRPSISRIVDQPLVWSRGSMILIGDAAHCASPSSGQGASMAIEDAVVLARSLRDVPETAGAFARFEQLRRARVERIVRHGARGNRAKTMGPVTRTLAEALMPLVFKRMAKSDALAWQYTYNTQ